MNNHVYGFLKKPMSFFMFLVITMLSCGGAGENFPWNLHSEAPVSNETNNTNNENSASVDAANVDASVENDADILQPQNQPQSQAQQAQRDESVIEGSATKALKGEIVAQDLRKLDTTGGTTIVTLMLVKQEGNLLSCAKRNHEEDLYLYMCTHAFRDLKKNPIGIESINTLPILPKEMRALNTFGRQQYGRQSRFDMITSFAASGVTVYLAHKLVNMTKMVQHLQSGKGFMLAVGIFIASDQLYSFIQRNHNAYRFPFNHSFATPMLSDGGYVDDYTKNLFKDSQDLDQESSSSPLPSGEPAVLDNGMDLWGLQQKLGLFLNVTQRVSDSEISFYCFPKFSSLHKATLTSEDISCLGLYAIQRRS